MSRPDTRRSGRHVRRAEQARAASADPPVPLRRGLSTLEMVLALPLLLFVMALMLNYGTVASWKVRALSVARHSVWANRSPRSGGLSPRPAYWPTAGAANAYTAAGNVAALADSRVDLPVARGPLPYGATVNSDLLDPQRGLVEGSSELTRAFPLLGSLGNYNLEAHNDLLDDTWEFGRMSWQGASLPYNTYRRIPVIYALPRTDTALSTAFSQAVMAALRASYRSSLRPLDDDEELDYLLTTYLGLPGAAPNFTYRWRLASRCSMEMDEQRLLVDNLVNRIQGVEQNGRLVRGAAYDLTRGFIREYNRIVTALQNLVNTTPPPPDSASIQAQINSLQTKIDTLQQFLETLQ